MSHELLQLVPELESYLPKRPEKPGTICAVLAGSFSRYHEALNRIGTKLSNAGIVVLAPKIAKLAGQLGDFQILDTDREMRKLIENRGIIMSDLEFRGMLESIYLLAITLADFMYVVVGDEEDKKMGKEIGYVGNTVAGEIGLALGCGKPVFASAILIPNLDEREDIIGIPHWEALAAKIPVLNTNKMVQIYHSVQYQQVSGQNNWNQTG